MNYIKRLFVNDSLPAINAENLNYMDSGIYKSINNENNPQTKNGDLTIGKNITVSSWAFSGTTITVNTAVAHGLEIGSSFIIDGLVATTNAPNGTWTVATVVDTDTITFIATNVPTGTPTVSSAFLLTGKIVIQVTEWGNNGVAYVDGYAAGANPSAIKYPDGRVKGTTDNGGVYMRYPDGTFDITWVGASVTTSVLAGGIYFSPALTKSYPIVATEIEVIPMVNDVNINYTWAGAIRNKTLTSVDLTICAGATTKNSILGYIAKGRYK